MATTHQGKKGNVSSYEVARLAGVSQATVSRVFSPGKAKVAEATRQRVLAATRKLNYQPSMIARSLTNKSTRMVAYISGRIDIEFFGRAFKYFTQKLQQDGYTTLFIPYPPGGDMEASVPLALQYMVEGIVIATASLSSRLAELCADTGTPVVLLDRHSAASNVSAVCLDNIQAGRDAAAYLINLGHRRLCFMTGDVDTSTNRDRQKGFIDAAREMGLAVRVVPAASYDYVDGHAAAKVLLEEGERPDAVFCATDHLAFALLDAARHHYGLDIPKDMSVMGLTDDSLSRYDSYNLTTIRQPLEEMVAGAIDILRDKAARKTDNNVVIKLYQGCIIERGTVADRSSR